MLGGRRRRGHILRAIEFRGRDLLRVVHGAAQAMNLQYE
jgi:hypothetical protein